jgi:hypothetical protein
MLSVEVLVPLAPAVSPLAEHAGLVFDLSHRLSHRLSIRMSKAAEGGFYTINTDEWLRTLRAELENNCLDAVTFFEVLVQLARWFSNPWAL